jgi:hypothetical protein
MGVSLLSTVLTLSRLHSASSQVRSMAVQLDTAARITRAHRHAGSSGPSAIPDLTTRVPPAALHADTHPLAAAASHISRMVRAPAETHIAFQGPY